jgi:hypothetical protein
MLDKGHTTDWEMSAVQLVIEWKEVRVIINSNEFTQIRSETN